MEPTKLDKYLDAAETTNNTTLCTAAAWDNFNSPMSDPVRDLLDCADRFGRPVRRLLLSTAALRAVRVHPESVRRAVEMGHDPKTIDTSWIEQRARLAPGVIEEDAALGPHILLLGESEDERYAIFNAMER